MTSAPGLSRGVEIAIRVLVIVAAAFAVFTEVVRSNAIAGAQADTAGLAALALRVLLALLVVWLCVRIDGVLGYLGRAGTEREEARDRRATAAVLVVLVSAGFLLRIADLGAPGLSWDEGMYAWLGASPTLAELFHNHSTRSPHPPGYFALLHAILEWTWDPFWLRLPSVAAGTALIWASHAWVRRIAGVPAGLLMAAFVTFAPTLVELSRVARNYALGFLLGVAAAALFVRFLQQDRRRDAVGFGVTSAVGLYFHYSALIVLAAQYVQLAVLGMLARRRPAWWVHVAASQLPVLLLVAFLYESHLSRLDPSVRSTHEWLYHTYMDRSWAQWLTPLADLWRYLAPLDLAMFALAAYVAGLGLLLVRRRYAVFFLCVLPLVSAYLLSWTGRYPLHGSRHSAYLFPFLFAPVAALGAELASGGDGLRGRLRGRDLAATRPAQDVSWPRRGGVIAVALALACFVDASMAEYRAPVSSTEAGTGRVREFLEDYRGVDINRAFEILETRAKPEDIVLLTEQGVYQFRHHYRLRPVTNEAAGAAPAKHLLFGSVPKETAQLEQSGVRFYYTPRVGRLFKWLDVGSVLDGYEEIRDTHGLKAPGSLWVLRGGWDPSFSEAFRKQLPGTPFDDQITRETADVLFRIDRKVLAATLAYRKMILMRSKGAGAQ